MASQTWQGCYWTPRRSSETCVLLSDISQHCIATSWSCLRPQLTHYMGRLPRITVPQLMISDKLSWQSSDKPSETVSPLMLNSWKRETHYVLTPAVNSGTWAELDSESKLIRVGGRLCWCNLTVILHPVVLDPVHPVTRLLIKSYWLTGSEHVFAEIKWRYWNLKGRQAVCRFDWLLEEENLMKSHQTRALTTQNSVSDLAPSLKDQLAAQQIEFHFNYVSSNAADTDPITPNSLLMGWQDSVLPQVAYPKSELLSRKQWRHSQILSDQFWNSLTWNYLPALQTFYKWQENKEELKVGSVVMLVDPQSPRALWLVGTVKTVMPGHDNRICAAEIQVKDRNLIRLMARLIRLPTLPPDDSWPNQKQICSDTFGGSC